MTWGVTLLRDAPTGTQHPPEGARVSMAFLKSIEALSFPLSINGVLEIICAAVLQAASYIDAQLPQPMHRDGILGYEGAAVIVKVTRLGRLELEKWTARQRCFNDPNLVKVDTLKDERS